MSVEGGGRYFTVMVPWEPDPAKRTAFHPTEDTGDFSILSRGAFDDATAAQVWADKTLGTETIYWIKTVGLAGAL